ncbi:MAG TPA: AarF/UbiB family protein [Planctomycetaceae bacterium]|nr:AarF/UbiB family protein [Planctomycetaceae bacterium]
MLLAASLTRDIKLAPENWTGTAVETHPFRFLRSLGRSREIATVLFNYGFGDVVERVGLSRYLRLGRRMFSRRRRREPERALTRPQRIRQALEELGPTFIKFGQIASTRPDLVPPDVVEELTKLQESVPPFPSQKSVMLLETELGAPVTELFAEFRLEPIAAASLAQVHWAVHQDGTPLAVKIRRPDVVRDIERDLTLMFEIATLAERHLPEAEVFDPVGLVNQFARSIRRELNFTREARTMDEFRRMFSSDPTVYIPRVYWDLTNEGVVTMEFIDAIKVNDIPALEAAGICPKAIAARGAQIFMRMSFDLGVFHGDPHPGNLRVRRDGTIALLDFGMVGSIDEDRRENLVDLFLAISHHDTERAVEVVLTIGRAYRDVDLNLLKSDLRDFIDTYYGLELDRINVGKLLSDFVGILSAHSIRCPAELMLWIRAVVTLEGVGRGLDPDFNLAQHLAPFVDKIVRERYSPKRIRERMYREGRRLLQAGYAMPLHIERTLQKLSTDNLTIQFEHRNLDRLITELDRSGNRITIGLVLSSMIVASALIIRSGASTEWITVPIFVASSFLGIWLIYGVFRSGRL